MASKPRRSGPRRSPRWERIRGVLLVGLVVFGGWLWFRVWNLQPTSEKQQRPPSPSALKTIPQPPAPLKSDPSPSQNQPTPHTSPDPSTSKPVPKAEPSPPPQPDQPLRAPPLDPLQPGNPSSIPPQMAGTIFRHLSAGVSERYIALTFDDGPWPQYTEQVLDILSHYAVPATFFWLGEAVQKYPVIAQKVAQAGHAIGNHTWSHATHTLSAEEAQTEIGRTAELIRETVGVETQMFRPPGGHKENGLNAWARQNGYAVIMWSVQTDDWKAASVQEIVDRALNNARPGTVMLLHDGGNDRSKTVEALPLIIEGLQAQGYVLVTVPELLRMEAGTR